MKFQYEQAQANPRLQVTAYQGHVVSSILLGRCAARNRGADFVEHRD
jgi:hypothetical protein